MSGTYVLKLTSAIAISGEVMKAGSLVEVSEHMEIEGAEKMTKAQLIESIEAAGETKEGDE